MTLALALAWLAGRSAVAATNAPSEPIFQRVVIIGASASAGFTAESGTNKPTADQLRLSRYWDAALLSTHDQVKSVATALFFLSPETTGQREISQTVALQPSLVVGSDFLFWFCYGQLGPNESRAARLETGLKMLESINCPLVIGNIPDASGADPDMLPADAIPTRAERDAANRRIKEWAAEHKNVVVFDLSGLMAEAAANEAITLHGHQWPAGTSRALLQADGLHPTTAGCSMLTIAGLDALCAANKGISQEAVLWDVQVIQGHVTGRFSFSATMPRPL